MREQMTENERERRFERSSVNGRPRGAAWFLLFMMAAAPAGAWAQTLGAPEPTAPDNGSTGQPVIVQISWAGVLGAVTYDLQVSTGPLFATIVFEDSSIVRTFQTVGPLSTGTIYYWRVRAEGVLGPGAWSEIWSFTTVPPLPDPPVLSGPANGTTGVGTSTTLSWHASTGAASYGVQVSTASNFGSLFADDSGLSGTSAQISSLAPGTTYYWRVNASNGAGTSAYSGAWSFATAAALPDTPAVPVLASPANGAVNQPASLSLQWNASSGASRYHLQLSASPSFAPAVVDDTSLTATSRAVGPLANGTTYYWRVNASNSGGTSAWSGARTFTTVAAPPSAPLLESPANGSTNQPASLSLSWTLSEGAAAYRLQLSANASFSPLLLDDSAITSTSRSVGPLAGGTTYYWHVNARNAGGTSAYSGAWSFTTAAALPDTPAVPVLASPANGATSQPASLSLQWNASSGASAYHLQLSASSSFSPLLVDDTSLTSTSRAVGPLASGTTFYWHVSARNAGGTSAYSGAWSFATAAALPDSPAVPVLASPANGATNQPTSLSLQWNASSGASTYHLQLSGAPTFSPLLVDDTSLTSTSRGVGPLSSGAAYYWRVSAKNARAQSAWSATWNFATAQGAPAAPVLASPASGSSGQSASPLLSWNAVTGAASYHLQVSTDQAFGSLAVDDSGIAATTRQVGPLSSNKKYYWRVSARNGGGVGAWSDVWNFTTSTDTIAAPNLLSPSNNASGQPQTLALSWSAVTGATSYHLQISTSQAFGTLILDDSTLAATSRSAGPLAGSTLYYWRVSSKSATAVSRWSNTWKFTTAADTLPAPILSAPADSAVNQPTVVTLSWLASAGASTYRLQVSASPVFAPTLLDDSTQTGTSESAGPLANNTAYFWRVNAKSSSGTSAWSEVRTFTTASGPTATTDPPSAVDALSAIFHGVAHPNGISTAAKFQFGTSTAYGSSITAVESPVAGSSPVPVTGIIRGLSPSTEYHYRLTVINSAGDGLGNDVTFETTPDQVGLISPANGSTNQPASPTLSWGTASGSAAFELQLSASSAFTSLAFDDSAIAGTSRSVSSLNNNATYYWRVRARNSGGWSIWSAVWSFSTLPASPLAPTPLSPADGSVNQPTTLTLRWNALPLAGSYRVQLAADSLFGTRLVDDSLLTDTVRQAGPLASQTKYFWRVSAKNAAGTGAWSVISSFTTVPPLPGPPALTAPANGATGIPTAVTLGWNAASGAISYHLQLSTGSAFTSNKIDTSGVIATSITASGLSPATLYYWRVDASNAGGTTGWSEVWSFTTVPAPPAGPLPVSPANGATALPASTTLLWKNPGGAAQYRLQLSDTLSFSAPVVDDSLLTDTSRHVGPLDNSTTYSWRVSAKNAGGWGPWSSVWIFTTVAAPPGPPVLASPSNGSTSQPTDLVLRWGASTGATLYRIQVAANTGFSPKVLDDSLSGTSREIPSLSNNTIYYWQVKAKGAGGWGDWSPVWAFATGATPPIPPTLASPANGATGQSVTPTLSWNGSIAATGYELQVSTNASFSAKVEDDTAVTGTSRVVGPLTNSTTYFWRVRTSVAVLTSDWSDIWTFSTAASVPDVPAAPSLSAPANGSTGQPSSGLTLRWNSSSGADGYHLQVSQSAGFSSTVTDDSGLTATSRPAGSLLASTVYYWHVRAGNSAGWSGWSGAWSFTTAGSGTAAPTATTMDTSGVTPGSATLTGSVNPNGQSTVVRFQYGTTASYGSQTTAAQSPVSGSAAVSVSAVVSGLTPSTTYHYRVMAQNDSGLVYGGDKSFTTPQNQSAQTITVAATVGFPAYPNLSQFKPSDYKLAGLPGAGSATLASLLPGTPGSGWQAYWDNGASANYMVRYDGSSGFRFTEGKAFWVIKNGPWSVNTTAPAAPVDSAGNATIALHAGWNLITNPFPSAVSWAAVRTANNVTDPIYSFAGSFNQSADFAPYAGYYFFNTNGLAALKIPNSPPGAASSAVQPAERREWKVNVIMISSEATDRSTWFGISGNAMRGLDPLDFRKPAGLLSGQAISFSRPEWDARYTEFATDMRPGIVDLEEWPFTVRSPGGGETVHLAFAGLRSLPAELDAYLVNDEGTVAQNLRADSVLSFVRQGTRSNFTVLVGTREAMNVRLSGIEPRTFFLGDNYPNPFNPATNLSVGIPTESDVMLAVFDMLGKEVKQLYKGTLKPGEYAFTWDGRDASGTTLPSGTYFSRLVAGRGTILTKKMVLVR